MICNDPHRNDTRWATLPDDQGGSGRHKCVGCAYEAGFQQGSSLSYQVTIDLDSLHDSQAGPGRHKSPHAAFAQGYLEGVMSAI